MLRTRAKCFLATAIAATALGAQAATVYQTGFEGLTPGSQLLGQDGWTNAIPPFLNPQAALIANVKPKSCTQHVRIRGADLNSAPEVGPQYAAVGSYRRPVNFDASAHANHLVHLEVDVRLDGPVAGNNDFVSGTLAARSNDGTVGELGISSDGKVYGYLPGTGIDTPPAQSANVTLGQYHRIGMDVDFLANTTQYILDGVPLGAPLAFDPSFASDLLLRGAIVAYARADNPPLTRAAYTLEYDNFSITSTPEPGSMLGIVFGAMLLKSRTRRS
jgi:hypothetical protein